jgi:cohesin loading factor subunit SCC2
MTENFASFEYKTLEEVLTIIRYLTTVLSTTGMQILELVSPSHLLTSLHEPARTSEPGDVMTVDPPASAAVQPDDLEKSLSLMRTTVVIAMVMLLKAYLKNLYSVSEEYVFLPLFRTRSFTDTLRKCQKFILGKKTPTGDRAAVKRHEQPISWDRLAYATKPILTAEDINVQKAQVCFMFNLHGIFT